MKYNKVLILTMGLLFNSLFTPSLMAANLTVSSNAPTIWFDDEDYISTWYEWSLNAYTEDNGSAGNFHLTDALGSSSPILIEQANISGITNLAFTARENGDVGLMNDSILLTHSNNDSNSFLLDSNGDISLANGSVFIDRSSNRIGVGTAIPEHELTLKSSDPTIQFIDTYGGYNWAWYLNSDISANKFDISCDASGVKKTLFELRDLGLGSSTYTYLNTDFVGIGTTDPAYKLDVNGTTFINGELNTTKAIGVKLEYSSDTNIQRAFKMSANNTNPAKKSDVGFVIENLEASFSWQIRTMQDYQGFAINKEGSGSKELIITGVDEAGGMELLLANGAKNSGGQWLDASSRAYKENIEVLDSQTAMEAFHKLQPVTYNYKTNKDEPIVGFIAEDVPAVVATNDRDALSALEMVALLTKVVQTKEKEMEEMKREINELQKMKQRLAQLESLLTNLAISTQNIEKKQLTLHLK